jgi:hypothetical protein
VVEVWPAVPQSKVEVVVGRMLQLFDLEGVLSPLASREEVARSEMPVRLVFKQLIGAGECRELPRPVPLRRKADGETFDDCLHEARRFRVRHAVVDLRHRSV